MKPTDFPSNGRDWEARRYGDFDISPNRRGRDTDYPVNDDNSPMKVANFNGVGGGTVIYTAHFPRMHPSDFRVKSLDGVADDWPIDYCDARAVLRRERPHDGRLGPRRRSRRTRRSKPPMPPIPLGKTGTRYARAMNRLGWHWWPSDTAIATTRLRRPRAVHQPRPLHAGLRAGRQGQHRHHLLAARHPRRRRAAHALPGARDHHRRARHGGRRDLLRRRRARSTSSRPRS